MWSTLPHNLYTLCILPYVHSTLCLLLNLYISLILQNYVLSILHQNLYRPIIVHSLLSQHQFNHFTLSTKICTKYSSPLSEYITYSTINVKSIISTIIYPLILFYYNKLNSLSIVIFQPYSLYYNMYNVVSAIL